MQVIVNLADKLVVRNCASIFHCRVALGRPGSDRPRAQPLGGWGGHDPP